MDDTKIILIAAVLGILVLSLSVHEAAHAWVAHLCGDDTAEREGRLTLNPIAHIDPWMTIVFPVLLYSIAGIWFGGARPVPVNPQRLRHPTRDMMFVALAGPISNFLQAILLMVLWKVVVVELGYPEDSLMVQALYWGVLLNVLQAVFNMLPVPPLDGSRVLAFFLPAGLRASYVSLERFGLLLVMALVFLVPGTQTVLTESMAWTWDKINLLTGGAW